MIKEEIENSFHLSEENIVSLREYSKSLICRFENVAEDSSECSYRKERLQNILNEAIDKESEGCIDRFFELTHEMESFLFLKQYGSVLTTSDKRHQPGADYIFNSNYYVECVCSTPGNKEANGLDKYLLKLGVFDYNEEKRLINARFTSSLYEKVDFYNKRLENCIPAGKPYLIFLSPGRLMYNWVAEEYGMALTDILFGRGNPTIIVNEITGEVVGRGYSHTTSFKKNNGAEISSNLFCSAEFKCVSGIVLACGMKEEYTSENTFLFVNPFANNPIEPSIFVNIPTWDANSNGEYRVFIK